MCLYFFISEEKTPKTPVTKKRNIQARERDDIIYDRMENAYKMLKEKSIPQLTTRERSESAIYGELIGKRLEQMEPDERDYVMHQIDNVMFEAKMSFKKNRYPSTQVNPNLHATTTFPSAQLNRNTVQILHVATPTPSPSTSTGTGIQYSEPSGPSSVETYIDGYSAKDYYECFE